MPRRDKAPGSSGLAENTAGVMRAGERQRQAANRMIREREALAEEASKRQRRIADVDDASTPAAKALARLRARVIAKQAHT